MYRANSRLFARRALQWQRRSATQRLDIATTRAETWIGQTNHCERNSLSVRFSRGIGFRSQSLSQIARHWFTNGTNVTAASCKIGDLKSAGESGGMPRRPQRLISLFSHDGGAMPRLAKLPFRIVDQCMKYYTTGY